MGKDVIVEKVSRNKTPKKSQSNPHLITVPLIDLTKYTTILSTTRLEQGDEYYNGANWSPTGCVGNIVGSSCSQYRRPLIKTVQNTAIDYIKRMGKYGKGYYN